MISHRQKPLSPSEIEELDRFYREGGLRQMASPHVHHHEPNCPHPGCDHKMEWINFQLELKPLVRSWWEGTGFSGRCPQCQRWIQCTTLAMNLLKDENASEITKLPDN